MFIILSKKMFLNTTKQLCDNSCFYFYWATYNWNAPFSCEMDISAVTPVQDHE